MNLKFNPILFIILISFFFIQCKKGCTDPNAVNYDPDAKKDNGSCYKYNLPVNLNCVVKIDIKNKKVDVEASSIGANFYSFVFYELTEPVTYFPSGNIASHIYLDTGNHQVVVRAHLLDNVFSEISTTIYIPSENDTTINDTTIFNEGYITPLSYPNYTLVWNDEFDDTSLNSNWVHELGNGCPNLCGWGNNESQYYRAENTSLDNGFLTITAKEENFGGFNYTSSRIKTQGIKSFTYGRIDIRAKLPYSQGLWPALWMLGENIDSLIWPRCGEIDIMELVGGIGNNDKTVLGTAHWYDNGNSLYSGTSTLSSGIYNDEFHVFTIVWDAFNIKWLRDDIEYHSMSINNIGAFHNDFFFIFNIAVGGNLPGNPNSSTVFPQQMVVDYLRVFQ